MVLALPVLLAMVVILAMMMLLMAMKLTVTGIRYTAEVYKADWDEDVGPKRPTLKPARTVYDLAGRLRCQNIAGAKRGCS